jgi:hypothetical protein
MTASKFISVALVRLADMECMDLTRPPDVEHTVDVPSVITSDKTTPRYERSTRNEVFAAWVAFLDFDLLPSRTGRFTCLAL